MRARGTGGPAALDERAVVVPLHERDVEIVQHCVQLVAHVCVGVGSREVEHQLVATQHGLVAGGDQRPVGVRPVQVAVGVHHLRLDPQPELHAQSAHVRDERTQAMGVDVG